MHEMFKAKVNSPQTELSESITSIQTDISVVNINALPDAPNICTIGTEENAETIRYTGKEGNQLTGVTRGFQGTAFGWEAATPVGRYFTAYDHDAFVDNISTIGKSIFATILVDTWIGTSAPYTQAIVVPDILASHNPLIMPVYHESDLPTIDAQKEAWNLIGRINTADGSIVVTCYGETPSIPLDIQIKGL